MRITSSRCHAFEYTVTAPAACAVELDAAAIGVVNSFADCLVVSIALDRVTDLAFTGEAVRTILRLAADEGAASVVIDGRFRPLPQRAGEWPRRDVLAELADSLDSVAEIGRRLAAAGARVHLMPFGWHKGIRAEMPEGEQRHRSVSIGGVGSDVCRTTDALTLGCGVNRAAAASFSVPNFTVSR